MRLPGTQPKPRFGHAFLPPHGNRLGHPHPSRSRRPRSSSSSRAKRSSCGETKLLQSSIPRRLGQVPGQHPKATKHENGKTLPPRKKAQANSKQPQTNGTQSNTVCSKTRGPVRCAGTPPVLQASVFGFLDVLRLLRGAEVRWIHGGPVPALNPVEEGDNIRHDKTLIRIL